uniref:Transmembrane protein 188 n=1 Tax=Panagrolaimus sp. PS1159 TaxID=55785 RepID=A0AC35FWZ5_9BILA
MKPKTYKWTAVLGVIFCAIIYSTYFLILDPDVRYVTVWESLRKHPTFAASIIAFFGLFFVGGIHRKLMAHKM